LAQETPYALKTASFVVIASRLRKRNGVAMLMRNTRSGLDEHAGRWHGWQGTTILVWTVAASPFGVPSNRDW
jgi:hypothetical protein